MALKDISVSALRMIQLAAIRRDPAIVRRDLETNGWIHHYRGGVFVTPQPRGVPWNLAYERTLDIFCYDYAPSPGDVVIELGAEFGTETVTLSRMVGLSGRVIAVEAHPWTCTLLRKTVGNNNLSNVSVVNAAISNKNGPVTISDLPVEKTRSNSLVNGAGGRVVEGITVDALTARFGVSQVDLVKMNIEGAERLALQGMNETMKSARHAVISCHDFKADAGQGDEFRTGADIDAALEAWGFSVRRRREDARPWVRDYRYARRR